MDTDGTVAFYRGYVKTPVELGIRFSAAGDKLAMMLLLGPDRHKQRRNAHHFDQPLHVVGENAEAHHGSYVCPCSGAEVRTAHSWFKRAEGMFDASATDSHGLAHQIEPLLLGIKHRFIRHRLSFTRQMVLPS